MLIKSKILIITNNESIIIISMNVIDLNSLNINFDFSFIFIFIIFEFFQK